MTDESTPQHEQPSEMEVLRAEMRAGFQSVARRFDAVDTRLDGNNERFVSLETRITSDVVATRTHFDVVAEGLRDSFRAVIDQTVATGKKVDRLIASNAIEHAAFQECTTDHEVRITRLERKADQDPPSPSADHQT